MKEYRKAEANRVRGNVFPVVLQERIGASWPRTLCHFDVGGQRVVGASIDGAAVPFQQGLDGRVGVFVDLPANATRTVAFEVAEVAEVAKVADVAEVAGVLRLGCATLPPMGETRYDPPADSLTVPPPILRLDKGGRGFLDTYERVTRMECRVVEQGPLWTTAHIRYDFDNGAVFDFECTAVEGEDFVRIREKANCGPKARWGLVFDRESGFLPDELDLADHTLYHTERRLDYLSDRFHARLYPWTQGTQIAALREGLMAHSSETGGTVGWFVLQEQDWDGFKHAFVEFHERRLDRGCIRSRDGETVGDTFSWLPPDSFGTRTDDVPAFVAESMLQEGSGRNYAIFTGKRRMWHCPHPVPAHTLEWYEGPALTDEWEKARSPLRRRIQQQGLLSLDIVKDWVLVGKSVPVENTETVFEGADNGTFEEIENRLKILATGFVMGRGPGGTNPVTLRCVFPFAARMAAGGKMPRDLTPYFLFLAYLESRRASYPGEFTMLPMADPRSSEPTCLGMPNENFLTDVYCVFGGMATVYPDHPAAKAWLERTNRLLGMQLDTFSHPESGVWEESHTYFHHVLRTLAPFALAQRTLPFGKDWYKDARFARLAGAALHFVTPRDPNAGGLRMMATLGDHRMELHWHTYQLLARGFAETRKTLARNLVWLSLENGWKGEPPVPPLRPKMVSHTVAGLGAVLRGSADSATGGESMVALRAGLTWGHHNCDELEVLYYDGGEPVVVEAGYGNPKTFAKVMASGHSILYPRTFMPAFYLSRVNRGVVDSFDADAGKMSARRLIAFRHPEGVLEPIPVDTYEQRRSVEWNEEKGELRIVDTWDGAAPQRLQFHTGGCAVEALGMGRLRIRGHRLDTLVRVSPALDWEIQPDACGFTIGFGADVPEGVRRVVTVFTRA